MAGKSVKKIIKHDPSGFDLVHADPPWRYKDESRNRGGAARWYDTMSIEELRQMNVGDYCKKDAYLFMWTTFPLLEESFSVLNAWGFRYSTVGFVWVKRTKNYWPNFALSLRRAFRAKFGKQKIVPVKDVLTFLNAEEMKRAGKDKWFWGMGSHTRANAEIVLIGLRGKPKREDKGIHQVLEELVQEHSVKPDAVYQRLDRFMGKGAKKFDVFTRLNRNGWAALGDQVERTDFEIDPETFQLVDVRPVQQKNNKTIRKQNEQPAINTTGDPSPELEDTSTEGRAIAAVS